MPRERVSVEDVPVALPDPLRRMVTEASQLVVEHVRSEGADGLLHSSWWIFGAATGYWFRAAVRSEDVQAGRAYSYAAVHSVDFDNPGRDQAAVWLLPAAETPVDEGDVYEEIEVVGDYGSVRVPTEIGQAILEHLPRP